MSWLRSRSIVCRQKEIHANLVPSRFRHSLARSLQPVNSVNDDLDSLFTTRLDTLNMAALSLSTARPSLNFSAVASRFLQPYFRPAWSVNCEPSSSSGPAPKSGVAASSATLGGAVGWSWTSLMPSLNGLLELFPPFLLTTPKKKTSHMKKAQRSTHKQLKNKTSESYLHLCRHVGSIRKEWKWA